MQTPAVPDLAHTRSRPLHWLATATAMAAVVAAAGLLQPEAATASQDGGSPKTAPAASASAPDPATADLPLECVGAKVLVTEKASGDLDGDGGPETVAVTRCDAGMGTPPNAVYVLARGKGTDARVVATLLEAAEGMNVNGLALSDGTITATLFGYSSPAVPRSNPDRQEKVKWQWQGGKFVRTAQTGALGMRPVTLRRP